MTKFFLSVYDYFSQRRSLLFGILAALAAVFIYGAYRIDFKEDISRFLPDNKDNERINDAYQYVASANTIIVYCSAANGETDSQIAAVDALAERLRTCMDTTFVKSVLCVIAPEDMLEISSFVIDNMPYFLDNEDYKRMDTLLSRKKISERLDANLALLTSYAGAALRNNLLADPLQMSAGLMRKLQDFKVGEQFVLYQDHLFTSDGEALLFIESNITASETANNELFIDSLNAMLRETESEYAGVRLQSFGAAEIGVSNARRIQKDIAVSMSLAVLIIFALLIYSFRSGRKILLVFASVIFGGIFALAALDVISGDVSIIAVGISSIMFGIAVNYPLHFIEHFGHAADSRTVIKDIIQPLTIGNITTVGAFLSLVFIGSAAMRDLGLFASLLLVGTILFVLFFLPHLLRGGKANAMQNAEYKGIWRFITSPFENNRRLIMLVIVLTVVFCFFCGDLRFETNMQNINYMTEAQKQSFDKMTGLLNQNQHVMYYVVEGQDMETALEANEKAMPVLQTLLADGEIKRLGGIGNFFPSKTRQAENIKAWSDFWSGRRDSVIAILKDESRKLGFRSDAFSHFETIISCDRPTVDPSFFAPLIDKIAKNYIIDKGGKYMIVNMLYTEREKAQALEEYLNENSPADDASQLSEANGIAFDAGSVVRRMIASLSANFNYVLYVCGFIVFAFLIFSLGRIELSIIAFIPLALSWIWILGLMNIFDIRFNIVNIILATFIFGQGDDYTIFMTEGLMYEYAYRRRMVASFKKSIALSALIMFVGIGSLIFAKHPALRSLAEVTIVGMTSVVVMSYIFPPLLFNLLTVRKKRKRMMPVTLKNFLCTIYAFMFFLIMSIYATITGIVMFLFTRKIEAKKMRYHTFLYRIAKFVISRIPQVKTFFHNPLGETFEHQGVIICNHQSHIDLMCLMMLTPKLIILTNDWVWNCPFYGRIIKMLDFHPVSNGIENVTDRLHNAVRRGYSIVIFPEGTRSKDCSIGRFHRGAFYLAEQLGVDIIPVLIHGVGHVLPKEEFMLRKGRIDVCVLPRIAPDDPRFSRGYATRSKEIRRYYQVEYAKLCREVETPDYYADLVIHNYIYKGPDIERAVRRNLKRHNNFAAEIAAQPDEGSVTIINSGYGEYPLLLALVKKNLMITAIESDPDRLAIAANCNSIPGNLKYVLS